MIQTAATTHGPVYLLKRVSWCLCSGLLLLISCGGNDGDYSAEVHFAAGQNPSLVDTFAYAAASPHAGVLKPCAIATTTASYCSMTTLPLIGQEATTPTVADVMDRVLVSHAWMGQRFEAVLSQLPPDILTLLKGVTAIVIDSDIRPSFYAAGTAAIYLDPAFLWLTNEEKATISRAPDFRSDFGAQLQFAYLWRYVKDNDYAYRSFPLSGTATRQLSDIIFPVADLLYHELAHANDFLPPARQPTLDRQLTPLAAAQTVADDQVASHLVASQPLTSSRWNALGQVLFSGVPATAEQQGYSADFVGLELEPDGANDAYNYATVREDVAMLFEEAMMKHHFGIDRDLAFTDLPATIVPVCDDFIVRWGVRNRLGDPAVRPRAELVAAELLPGTDLSSLFAAFPTPAPLTAGLGWCANLALGTAAPLGLAPARGIPPEQLLHDRLPPGR